MTKISSPARQIEAIFEEADPIRRSQLVVERLLGWSRDRGHHHWVLGPVHLFDRGALVRVDGALWRWLPTEQPVSVAGCISGAVVQEASDVLREVRKVLGDVALEYVPTGVHEGMLVEETRWTQLTSSRL